MAYQSTQDNNNFFLSMLATPMFFACRIFNCYNATAQTTNDLKAGKANGVWWTNNNILQVALEAGGIGASISPIKSAYPATRGVFATITWSSLKPPIDPSPYKWPLLDSTLKSFSDSGFYMILMIWAGPDCPDWIYGPGYNVPAVTTNDPDHPKTPFYFIRNASGDSVYKKEWYKMLDSVAAHIKNYSGIMMPVRRKIVAMQSAEGSTGDEGPYKGKYVAGTQDSVKIDPGGPGWIGYKRAAWKKQDTLYQYPNLSPFIHLMLNTDPGDAVDSGNWLQANVPNAWRKANLAGHGYQFNGEQAKKASYKPLVDSPYTSISDSVTYARCRDEMDLYNNNTWYSIRPRWFNFYQAASALHFGLDIWTNSTPGMLDTVNTHPGFDLFSKYAGRKNAKTAPGGFCILREGLDAADTVRFPTATYGSGTQDKNDAAGMARCLNIANAYTVFAGAKQEDTAHAQGDGVNQKKATKLNDVGWGIFPGNYERYVTQIISTDTAKNGQGYWRVSRPDSNFYYGRFAKGFKHFSNNAQNKDTLFFRIDDALLDSAADGSKSCTLRVVYYDTIKNAAGDTATWKVLYDAKTNSAKFLGQVVGIPNSATLTNYQFYKWKEALFPVTDGWFRHRGRFSSDFMLVNANLRNDVFALVEIIKPSP